MKIISGGVTAPKGFSSAGIQAGIKDGNSHKDMAMIVSKEPAAYAGTFTKNTVKAAPVLWDQQLLNENSKIKAVVINTGVANACTGPEGMSNTKITAEAVAGKMGISSKEVLVGSTGVIGAQLPMDVILKGVDLLIKNLGTTREHANDAAAAIMTTDTRTKECAVTATIDGCTVTIAGMCKGSGMIHPNMGTMLAYLTTDAAIDADLLLEMQKEIVTDSFNMISVDGDTSTNDTAVVLANGMAGNSKITQKGRDYDLLFQALSFVNQELAKKIAADGEGCTKLIEAEVAGAVTKEDARIIAKAVISSTLTKAAIFGKDANWGRILCAMGYSGGTFDPDKVEIGLESAAGKIEIVKKGTATNYSEDQATRILSEETVMITMNLYDGDFSATAWGCDLTYDYVTINADYRS